MWKLDNKTLPGTQYWSANGTVESNLTIARVSWTRAKLRCYLAGMGTGTKTETPQLIATADIQAGRESTCACHHTGPQHPLPFPVCAPGHLAHRV